MATSTRRYRTTSRMYVAGVLLVVAALAVGAAAYLGSPALLTVAGAGAVVVGAIAVRLIYADLLDTRFAAASDRASQARAYRALASKRAEETQTVVDGLTGRLTEAQEHVAELSATVDGLQVEVVETAKAHHEAVQRAEAAEAATLVERDRAERAEHIAAKAEAQAIEAGAKVEESVRRIVDLEAQVTEQQAALSMRERHTA